MKRKIIGLLLFTALVEPSFGIDKITHPISSDSCAVRLSNEPMTNTTPREGTEFCTGSLLEDGSKVIFAAHCLNQIFFKDSDRFDGNSFEISFSGHDFSETVKLQKGKYSLFVGSLLDKMGARKDFIDSADTKYIKDDVAIFQFATPLAKSKKCPVLPSAEDCKEFEKQVLEFGSGAGIYTDFFISKKIMRETDMIKKVSSYYPGEDSIEVKMSDIVFSPSSAEVKNLEAPLKVSFSHSGDSIRMRKGDSGSLAYWKRSSEKIAVGVQSVTVNTPEKAYFANICKQVGTPKFAEFLKNKPSSMDTKDKQGIEYIEISVSK